MCAHGSLALQQTTRWRARAGSGSRFGFDSPRRFNFDFASSTSSLFFTLSTASSSARYASCLSTTITIIPRRPLRSAADSLPDRAALVCRLALWQHNPKRCLERDPPEVHAIVNPRTPPGCLQTAGAQSQSP